MLVWLRLLKGNLKVGIRNLELGINDLVISLKLSFLCMQESIELPVNTDNRFRLKSEMTTIYDFLRLFYSSILRTFLSF